MELLPRSVYLLAHTFLLVSKDLKNEIHTSEHPSYNSSRRQSVPPIAAILRGISAQGREWFPGTGKWVTLRVEVGSVRIVGSESGLLSLSGVETRNVSYGLPTSSNHRRWFHRNTASWSVKSFSVFHLSSFLSLPLSLALSILVSLSLSLPISISSHRRGVARHRHAYTHSSVCMFCGWLCSDSRRSTRGYYIVKPFNYLGKLLPGIYIRPGLP